MMITASEARSVSVVVGQVYTREEAGKQLFPKVGAKQINRYLHILTVFSPNFKKFKNPLTGELNGEPITTWELEELQTVRQLYADYRKTLRVQIELAKHYQNLNYNNQGI